ncbi:thioredoxin domain-containing protein [Leucobacter sp. UCMA 4100]|uniref:DsbA family protein n=1 Tax=Leucobacter sp. UCMA 4100 TaxID=2810534 RepID=UPI0022EA9A03|nr:thioredoxin domain-containing protein [Leucobacter sp. UCMA 4100]MDA3147767.1 thioredoxin domain-containing protein [Leucobacter sp. UCMA 4100]
MNVTHSEQTVAQLSKKLRQQRILSLILAIALVFVGVAYSLLWSETKSDGNHAQGDTEQIADGGDQTAAEPDLSAEPYMVLGEADAPVTIYEWTDYTCPYCGLYHRETLPTIVKEYIDSGKVRLEVHDVTFIGEQAEDAAVAARAAGLQDHYFDYLFKVYGLSADGAKPNLDEQQLTDLAAELDLDLDTFAKDFASEGLRQEVQASTQQAQQMGISGVPFFVVATSGTLADSQQLNGAQEIDTFRQVIDQQLESAGR